MKVFFLSFVIAAGLLAQTAPATHPVPGTTATSTPTPPGASSAAPTLQAPASPETVVAKVGGKEYTAAEVDKMLQELPAQLQVAVSRNPQLLTQVFMIRSLSQQAESQALDKDPRYKQQLEYGRMNLLAQAELNHYRESIQITPEKQQEYYNNNKEQYQTATVKAIFVSFSAPAKTAGTPAPPSSTTTRTKEEAKAKIEDLRKQILAGADFAKLATEQSDDKTSAAKGGDYGDITRAGPYPEKVKIAVFRLKSGEVSEPVEEPNGYYLFKLVQLTQQPFDKVQNQILQTMQQAEFQSWIKGVEARNKVTIENPGWFTSRNAR